MRREVEHEPGCHLFLVAGTEAETLALMSQPASLAHDAADPRRPWCFGDAPGQVVGSHVRPAVMMPAGSDRRRMPPAVPGSRGGRVDSSGSRSRPERQRDHDRRLRFQRKQPAISHDTDRRTPRVTAPVGRSQTSPAVEAFPCRGDREPRSVPDRFARGAPPWRALLLVPTTRVDPRVGPCVTIRVIGHSDQKITFRSCLSIGPGWIVP